MIPFIIAGAVGFGIAKLFEKDDNKKFEGGGELKYKFPNGSVVWDKSNKIYGVVLNNFGNEYEGGDGELRLDSDGIQSIFRYDKESNQREYYNLVPYGSVEDEGNGNLKEAKESAKRIIELAKSTKDKEHTAYYTDIYSDLLSGKFDKKYDIGGKITRYSSNMQNPKYKFFREESEYETLNYKGEEYDFNLIFGFHNGGIDSESGNELPSGYYARIDPIAIGDTSTKHILKKNDFEYSFVGELWNLTMLILKAEEDTKENKNQAIKLFQEKRTDLINEFKEYINDYVLGTYSEYAGGGGIGIGRYSILAQHSNGEEPLVMKRVNNRNEIAGMVDKVELAFKKLGYNDVTIFVTDEETDDEVYNYAEGGEAGKYVLENQGRLGYAVLNTKTNMYVDIDFQSKEDAENFIIEKNREKRLFGFEPRLNVGSEGYKGGGHLQETYIIEDIEDVDIRSSYTEEELKEYIEDWNRNMETNYQDWKDFNNGEEYYRITPLSKYDNGGGVGKYNTYKLRAEGLNDFMNFLGTGVYSNVKSYTVEPIGFPDVAVSFETNLSLSEIKAKLREVQDSHVMLETIKPIKEYTGERYAGGGDVKSMSDEEIENEYNKILSVQILAGDIDEDEVEELSISEKREFLENYKDEYAKGGLAKKRRRIASIQYGRSDRSVDKTRFAKPVGYRYTDEKATQLNKKTYTKPTEAQVKKYLGNGIYKENRKNRSDKDRKVKL